jgi:hypothetical protein
MFKQLSPSAVEKMRAEGKIMLTVLTGWEMVTTLHAVPFKINMCIGNQLDHIFNCYLYSHAKTIVISDIEPSSAIVGKKRVIDGYLDLAIDGIVKYAKMQNAARVLVDSRIKCLADHLPQYGFKIIEVEDNTKSIKGILTLK